MRQLQNADKDLLEQMRQVYNDYLSKKIENASDFIWLAHETGDIASSGDKYAENVKFWEVKDNIRKHIENTKAKVNNLIRELVK